MKDVHWLYNLGIRLKDSPSGSFMVHHNNELSLFVDVNSKQHLNSSFIEFRKLVPSNLSDSFVIRFILVPLRCIMTLGKCFGEMA